MSTVVPRLVVTDLDGTFLSPDGTVSEANARAVRDWCASGREFLIATGRPVRWLEPVQDVAGIRPRVIASNGAVVHDVATGESTVHHPIDVTVAEAVIADLRAELPDTWFGIEFGHRFGHEPGYRLGGPVEPHLPSISTGEIDALLDQGPFVKLLVQNLALAADELVRRAEPVVGGRLTITHSSSGRGLLEVSAAGVSKATTLARTCELLGVSAHEVAAFGDMPNDREMLAWAGLPHVMANSHPEVLGLGRVIGSNSESAVGAVLDQWLADRVADVAVHPQ